jgi:ABC-type oligopeptide transport system substrate-binding subunit
MQPSRRTPARAGLVILAVIGAVLCAAGCSSVSSRSTTSKHAAAKVRSGGTLRFGLISPPLTLDPMEVAQRNDITVARTMYASLFQMDSHQHVVPDLATSLTTSSDGKTATIKLRPNLKWSDGTPLTSADVVRTFQQFFDPKLHTQPNPLRLNGIVNGDDVSSGKLPPAKLGVVAVDPTTVQVKFTDANYLLQDVLTMPNMAPLPPMASYVPTNAKQRKQGPPYKWWANKPVVSGPFMPTSPTAKIDKATELDLVRNPNYWDAAHTQADALKLYFLRGIGETYTRYRSGQIDGGIINLPDLSTIQRVGLHAEAGPVTVSLVLRSDKPRITSNILVRKAIWLALDRTQIANHDHTGNVPTMRLSPPTVDDASFIHTLAGQNNDPSAKPNLTQVQSLLAQAHVGPHPKLTILAADASDESKEDAVATSLNAAGFVVNVIAAPRPEDFLNMAINSIGKWDASLDKDYQYYPDAYGVLSDWDFGPTATNSDKTTEGADPRYDKALTDAYAAPTAQARYADEQKAEGILTGEDSLHMVLPMYNQSTPIIYGPKLGGDLDPTGAYLYLGRISVGH